MNVSLHPLCQMWCVCVLLRHVLLQQHVCTLREASRIVRTHFHNGMHRRVTQTTQH